MSQIINGITIPAGYTQETLFRERHCEFCLPSCGCGKERDKPHADGCTHVCKHLYQALAPVAPLSLEHEAVKKCLWHLRHAEMQSLVFNRMSGEEMAKARLLMKQLTESLNSTDVMPWPGE